MIERGFSGTAQGVALLRAAHQLIDEEPRILDDPIVLRLLDTQTLDQIRINSNHFKTPIMNDQRSYIITRSRYTEDRLAEAVRRGITQYAILGSGFDTFAYRQPVWGQSLRIFEIDHPASQSAKQEHLRSAGIEIPPNVEFVAIDFELNSLRSSLSLCGFDSSKPTFLSCLGVMVYLSEEAIDDIFRFVATLPPSSEMVFTFIPKDSLVKEDGVGVVEEIASACGEPWRSRIDPALLVQKLLGFGFSAVSFLTPLETHESYYQGRHDGLSASWDVHTANAMV